MKQQNALCNFNSLPLVMVLGAIFCLLSFVLTVTISSPIFVIASIGSGVGIFRSDVVTTDVFVVVVVVVVIISVIVAAVVVAMVAVVTTVFINPQVSDFKSVVPLSSHRSMMSASSCASLPRGDVSDVILGNGVL